MSEQKQRSETRILRTERPMQQKMIALNTYWLEPCELCQDDEETHEQGAIGYSVAVFEDREDVHIPLCKLHIDDAQRVIGYVLLTKGEDKAGSE